MKKAIALRKSVCCCYAGFGFTKSEVFHCELCGVEEDQELTSQGFSLTAYSVPITETCPVAGLVGICRHCLKHITDYTNPFRGDSFKAREIDPETGSIVYPRKEWTPPHMVQPMKTAPIYLLPRGFCDDNGLNDCIRETWKRIPTEPRQVMTKFLKLPEVTEECSGFCKGALRVEALPNWPERKRARGQCLHRGHAIRLNSAIVKAMPDNVLMTLIAHELGHTYQWAARRLERRPRPQSKEKIEEDVHAIMQGWGFRQKDIYTWWDHRQEERWQAEDEKYAREWAALARARTSEVLKSFADHCREAQLGSKTMSYKSAAYELAEHVSAFQEERTRLNDLCNAQDDEGIWQWFRDHYPDFMELVPTRRKRTFLNGIYEAHEDEWIF